MIQIEIRSYHVKEIAEQNPDLYEILRKHNGSGLPERDKCIKDGYHSFSGFVNDMNDIPEEVYTRCEFKRIKPLWTADFKGAVRASNLASALQSHHVHLPGNELLAIKEVFVETDCCTETINSHLQDGWRIIAICPQPGQRRPDYVLGKGFGSKQETPIDGTDSPF